MDEVKALEENLTSNGEESAKLVTNGELESETDVGKEDTENGSNAEENFGNSSSEQDTSKGSEIEEEASTDPKPLDDRLTSSQEILIQPDDHVQEEIPSSLPLETSEEPEANNPTRNPESPSGETNGEICNHDQKAFNGISPLEKTGSEKPLRKSYSNVDTIAPLEKADSGKKLQKTYSNAIIDTTAPFESVKAAVSMFGGIIDWKAHKLQTAEKRKYIIQELKKAREEIPLYKKKSEKAEESKLHVLKELDDTKRLVEELKLNLERAQTEERQAKQDAELAKLRVEEMEQGIADDSSVAAKIQREVAHARHEAAVSEVKTVKKELEDLQNDYELLVSERDVAIKNAKEAVSNSKEIEKQVEGLTIKLMTTKEALESAHAARMEAEEYRTGIGMAREEDTLNWAKELKESESELEKVDRQIVSVEDLKSKLETASVLLHDLKSELAAYMGENHEKEMENNESLNNNSNTRKQMQDAIDVEKIKLEEGNKSIELATNEVKSLKQAANSLNSELEKEKSTLIAIKRRQGMASVTVASLECDLNRTISEISLIQKKEKLAREKAIELPKQLQKAAEEADHAKSLARSAHEELQKAKEKADQAKAGAETMRSRLIAAQKEIEAARASERLAVGAITALHETESARKSEGESGVTISLEDYYELTRKAQEAETEANCRVSEAMSKIDLAKESEVKTVNNLEKVNSDIVLKRKQLSIAKEKAEKAKEGKLAVEQELRTWRSESEQRRKAKENGRQKGLVRGKEGKSSESFNNVTGSSREGKTRKKKKKSFFPRFLMFFSKKKGHSNKNNNNNNNSNNT
ncbi:hypothetical protein Lser_V15G31201 [Lactuca serriola]